MYWSTYGRGAWDPFAELKTLQREMNRLFEGSAPGFASRSLPALNLWSNGEEALVSVELPGVEPNDIEINVLRDELTLKAERKAPELGEETLCHRAERETGRVVRSLRLPFDVENDKVSASYERGVLTIRLPRAESTKPRRIAIRTA